MKPIELPNGDSLIVVNATDLQKNFTRITKYLREGFFVELRKHNVKVGMIVPY